MICRKKGFTLIELLVVIAIIALLVSILMPALNKARAQARGVVCFTNVKNWGLITHMYAEDNDGRLMQSIAGDGVSGQDAYWIHATLKYYDDKSIRICPATKVVARAAGYHYGKTFEAWGPFSSSGQGDWKEQFSVGSYGINEWCACPPVGAQTYWGFSSANAWRKMNVSGANTIPLFMDSMFVDGFCRDTDQPPLYENEFNGWGSNAMKLFCMPRHNGGINVVFLDMSVRHVPMKELWQLKWHKKFNLANQYSGPAAPWPEWMDKY